MLYNLTCERSFHPALLEAGITYTLIDILGTSTITSTSAGGGPTTKVPLPNATTSLGAAGVAARTSPPPERLTILRHATVGSIKTLTIAEPGGSDSAGDLVSSNHQAPTAADMSKDKGGVTRGDSGSRAEESGGGGRVFQELCQNPQDVGGGKSGGMSDAADTIDGGSDDGDDHDGSGGGDGGGGGGGGGQNKGAAHKTSLQVRQNVLGALMNLTTASLSHPRLEPSAVMTLLTLVTQEDCSERYVCVFLDLDVYCVVVETVSWGPMNLVNVIFCTNKILPPLRANVPHFFPPPHRFAHDGLSSLSQR